MGSATRAGDRFPRTTRGGDTVAPITSSSVLPFSACSSERPITSVRLLGVEGERGLAAPLALGVTLALGFHLGTGLGGGLPGSRPRLPMICGSKGGFTPRRAGFESTRRCMEEEGERAGKREEPQRDETAAGGFVLVCKLTHARTKRETRVHSTVNISSSNSSEQKSTHLFSHCMQILSAQL